jgi:hypothetical protein
MQTRRGGEYLSDHLMSWKNSLRRGHARLPRSGLINDHGGMSSIDGHVENPSLPIEEFQCMNKLLFRFEHSIHTIDEITVFVPRCYQDPVTLHHDLELHAEHVIAKERAMVLGEIDARAVLPFRSFHSSLPLFVHSRMYCYACRQDLTDSP